MTKQVLRFGCGDPIDPSEPAATKELLGGKGFGLRTMASLGIPVPPGLTITTEVCHEFFHAGKKLPEAVKAEVLVSLAAVEKAVGAGFGSTEHPLLLSVRSGARASMPGMMDTILNLGLNEDTCRALATVTQNERFALDSYRRFITMYSDVVLGLEREPFERILADLRRVEGARDDGSLSAQGLRAVVDRFLQHVHVVSGSPFPTDPKEQLWGAIAAVFDSWHNERAKVYRGMHGIPESWGTACTVQAMVFGNMGDDSATGV